MNSPPSGAIAELAPTGPLRFGLVSAPDVSPLFVVKDAAGGVRGPAFTLACALANAAGVDIDLTVAPNTGELTEGLAGGRLDAAFMPADDERRKRLNFTSDYFVAENTFLVRASCDIHTIAEVDRPQVRVIAIAGTTTIRTTARTLVNTRVVPADSIADALEMLRSDAADAFALTHDSLPGLAARLPGSRILPGAFHRVGIALALPRGKPTALAFASRFIEDARGSGLIRGAFDDSGLHNAGVAPQLAAT